jgi:two-component system, OmpR family, sensor kinase
MLNIKTKIVLSSVLVFGAVLAMFAVVVYHNVERAEVEKFDTLLESRWKAMRDEIDEGNEEGNIPRSGDLQAVAGTHLPGTCIVLRTAANRSIMPEDSSAAALWTQIQRSADGTRRPAVPDTSVQRAACVLKGERARFFYAPVTIDHRIMYDLLIVAPMREAEERLRDLRVQFMVAIPLALLLAGLGAWIIARLAFRPIARMINTSSAITAENLDLRVALPNARDEVRLLGETLNQMIGRIAAAFESQQQFVADASHELRTPLTVIRTELEFALRTVQDPAARESIGIALGESDRLAQMAVQLLQLSRLDASPHALRRDRVHLDGLAADAVHAFRLIASQKRIAIELDAAEAIECVCDEEKLKSALHNIIENAVNYSPEGSAIRIRIARCAGGSVSIAVQDSGCGIAEADLPHLFSRFYRGQAVRGATEGSGLGLAIAGKIVSLHGGRIDVGNNLPSGTVFTIVLPA